MEKNKNPQTNKGRKMTQTNHASPQEQIQIPEDLQEIRKASPLQKQSRKTRKYKNG